MLVRPKNKSYVGAFPDLPDQLPHFQLAHPAKQSLLLDGLVEATPCEGVLLMLLIKVPSQSRKSLPPTIR